ncbi:MAG: hypothetical protein GOMPHAMPRED_000705 [Gomphillus americanus]|uniref:RING-type E3 ubiquitin transferase n=1 Tax=Gomphillus americanus TaxID=1940652 RepID=A0A8H3F0K4_9LECA|nr:MAG: hypothetical protein GOMPHAMPRED_000705 [Gomphillus americanus]
MATVEGSQSQSFVYPYAAAPDIIRSAEKDKYFQSVLLQHLSNVLRKLYGSRYLHIHSSGLTTFTELLYFCSTTLIGNRTLGEEYCDIVQVEEKGFKRPGLLQRSGFIISSILLPYFAGKAVPRIKPYIEQRLQAGLREGDEKRSSAQPIRRYLLNNLDTIMSPSLIYGIGLAVFYFTGSYYHLSKRLFKLRYVFTRIEKNTDEQISYEVLGALLTIQMIAQGWMHAQATLKSNQGEIVQLEKIGAPGVGTFNTITNTPHSKDPIYILKDENTFGWIQGEQQRKCTLCLEELKDPSATTCGHVFCWECIAGWIQEKPECPLCRQSIQAQHVLPLRG